MCSVTMFINDLCIAQFPEPSWASLILQFIRVVMGQSHSTETLLAVAGASALAGGLIAYATLQSTQPSSASIEPLRTRLAHRAPKRDDAELLEEQLSRNKLYFGDDGQAKFSSSFVVVVGLGGVGSHAAHMMARAGVGKLRLVDFDNLTLSSLNRHAVGTRDDVGRPKVEVCQRHFHDVLPTVEVEAVTAMFTGDQADELLAGQPDYVIDAIDDVNTKADLVLACTRLGLPVISAMGAGAKADPTRVVIGDITDPVNDPLASKLRSFIRSRLFADGTPEERTAKFQSCVDNFRVCYSYEPPQAQLAELTDEQSEEPDAFGAVANMRLRVLPVLGTMPAIVGMSCAAFVMTTLAGKPLEPRQIEVVSQKFAHKLQNRLVTREAKEFGNTSGDDALPIADQNEVSYVVENIWKSRSAYQMHERTRAATRNLNLTRFDRSKPALPYNLVLLTDVEASWHDAETRLTGSLPGMLVHGRHDKDVKCAPSSVTLRKAQGMLAKLEAVWKE
eukprot:TRINITY_DN9329_c0_g1_i2.p1 TRINITY_DN9329_c0_g1~~TRINITY_DN9329_c0_g1_i2.p1  ORF type:complete len:504 (+),score=118.47 TRINITY_DN9329_c0_g1_i2:1191-2702(+)